MRKPSEKEQSVIMAGWALLNDNKISTNPRDRPVTHYENRHYIAMGSSLIEDEQGRWDTLLGIQCVEVREMGPWEIGLVTVRSYIGSYPWEPETT